MPKGPMRAVKVCRGPCARSSGYSRTVRRCGRDARVRVIVDIALPHPPATICGSCILPSRCHRE
ncbi:Hypothetical protein SMAX5B_019100 [Scophthalmus maximus]|uniref:Uncharacterized protein n=1 Tax=Scophthalmus maximus TaxID=52904 RepID=A0A2U9C9A8_SCOMX|nr:Hypothetical protein SMAX5B_019100 [Scophthalmus maximus]